MHWDKIFQADDYVNKVVCESNESCWGNGICDPILNSTEYCYDGGDCSYKYAMSGEEIGKETY